MKKLFIIFAILCLAAPAMAADWNFYGHSRFATWYVDDDYDTDTGVYDDDADVQWENGGNSRFGATVQANDQIGGGFEIGFDGGTTYARKIFGTYTMASGSQLLVGRTYTPTAMFYSNSVYGGDGDLLGLGEYYDGRLDMIQFKAGGFKVALIDPNVVGVDDPTINTTLPKVEVSYGLKMDMFFLDVAAGYQTYEVDGAAIGLGTEDVDSYIGILGGGVNLGAFFAKGLVHMGQNLGDFGSAGPYVTSAVMGPVTTGATIDLTTGEVYDTDALGFLCVVGFNASEMLTFEGGVGYQNYDSDVAGSDDETLMQYYVNATINIAPGFFIVPEVGMVTYDSGVDNAPEPERFYAGAKWQINF